MSNVGNFDLLSKLVYLLFKKASAATTITAAVTKILLNFSREILIASIAVKVSR